MLRPYREAASHAPSRRTSITIDHSLPPLAHRLCRRLLAVSDGVSPMSALSITLFGPPAITLHGAPVSIRGRKATALLAYLAMTRRQHSREALATLLWPEHEAALAQLRQALWQLRQAGLGPWLISDRDLVRMRPDCELDVLVFEAACATRQHELAAACYSADFLAGFVLRDAPAFDEWQFYEAERLRQLLARTLQHLAEELAQASAYERALDYARRWLALDPLHEPAHRALMRLYALAGQRSAALRQYETCVVLLADELGAAPEEATRSLYEQIRQRALALPAGPAAMAAPEALEDPLEGRSGGAQGNLAAPFGAHPEAGGRLLGRETELATIDGLLSSAEQRLISIVGLGGSGKTRLARAAAERQAGRRRFAAAHFIELASLADPERLVPTLATALGVQLTSGHANDQSQRQQLLDTLAPRRLLLVLDNFEQLREGAGLIAEILRAAPAITIIVTSRERLGLHAEQVLTLQGLSAPAEATAEQIEASPAAQLFLQAARRVAHDFALASTDLPHLVTICQLVAGMPLALELAATWAEVLSLEAISAEIQRGIDLLASAAIDLPERQRSIRAVCESSWQRLDPEEQRLFARLAVFRGGFTAEAAREVAEAMPAGLVRLAHGSLLAYDRERKRYQIHELVRQYAAEQLAGDPKLERQAQDRHAAYFCAMLGRLVTELRGPRQQAAMAACANERENVRAAWIWAGSSGRWADLAQAADCLGYIWKWQTAFDDGMALFGNAADALAQSKASPAEGGCLLTLALLRIWQSGFVRLLGQRGEADQLLAQAVNLLDSVEGGGAGVCQVRAFALLQLGQAAHDAGRPEARRLYEQSRDAYDTPATRWEQSAALAALGHLNHDQGEFAAAEAQFAASLAIRQACGDQRGVAYVLELWSQTAAEAGRPGDAEILARRSYAIYQDLGDQVSSATGLGKLGVIQMWLGAYASARDTLAASLAQYQQLANHAAVARARCRLGLALGALGAYDQAQREVQLGMAALRGIGKPLDHAWGQWVAGMVLIGMGALPEAAAALEESVAHYRERGHLGQVGWPLALLAHIALERGDLAVAEAHLLAVLHERGGRRDFLPLIEALPTAARILAHRGRTERAVELVALARCYPVLVNSQVYAAILNQAHAEVAHGLAEDACVAATARGQRLDIWQTAEVLLEDLAHPERQLAGRPDSPAALELDLDEGARELLVAGRRVGLAPLEFALLHYLIEREGQAVSRTALLADVWGYSYEGGSNVVDAVVRALRKKLGPCASTLETVTKVGYRFRRPA
jgi:DNA-binding SARP family transcriptional activator/predicted ATPase